MLWNASLCQSIDKLKQKPKWEGVKQKKNEFEKDKKEKYQNRIIFLKFQQILMMIIIIIINSGSY